ncbi:MAG: sigma factor-like helix-turn-helix DNA-binding protein [Ignavibacteriaceae bacterium]|jgi:RNA polymerase sigma-70 factor (ECF subfamily)|nr:sigma factor-like helix-turn-helix DNA-binding protein [Ignavibacteriaceae bacterium]
MFASAITAVNSEQKKLNEEFGHKAIPHLDELYDFAFRVTGNSKYAGDLLIETYKRAYWFWAHLDERISCKVWLLRVMRNTYTSIYWKKIKEFDTIKYEEIEKLYEDIKSSASQNALLQKKNYNLPERKITEIISSLPYDLRIVIILCDILGSSYDDIADFADVPVGVVRSRLFRARKILFTELQKYLNINDNDYKVQND